MEKVFSSSFDSDYNFEGFQLRSMEKKQDGGRRSRSRSLGHGSQSEGPGRRTRPRSRSRLKETDPEEDTRKSRTESRSSSSSHSDRRGPQKTRPTSGRSRSKHTSTRKRRRSRSRTSSSSSTSRSPVRKHKRPHSRRNTAPLSANANDNQDANSEQFANLDFRVNRIENFLEKIATHMGLNGDEDRMPGPCAHVERPGANLGPSSDKIGGHGGAQHGETLVSEGRESRQEERAADEMSLAASDTGFQDPPEEGEDLRKVIFNPVKDKKTKYTPEEGVIDLVKKYFGSKIDRDAIQSQISEDHGIPEIPNFIPPQINETILRAQKVQNARNVLEGDKHITAIQQMLVASSLPLIKLWNNLLATQHENNDYCIDIEEVVKIVQQSLCAIGSSFRGLNTHRRRRFKGCLAKEFESLADSDSEDGLSPYLFGSNLAEKVKSQADMNAICKKIARPLADSKPKGQNTSGKRRMVFKPRNQGRRSKGYRQGNRSRSNPQKEQKTANTQTKSG